MLKPCDMPVCLLKTKSAWAHDCVTSIWRRRPRAFAIAEDCGVAGVASLHMAGWHSTAARQSKPNPPCCGTGCLTVAGLLLKNSHTCTHVRWTLQTPAARLAATATQVFGDAVSDPHSHLDGLLARQTDA